MLHMLAWIMALGVAWSIIVESLLEKPSKRIKFDKERWPKEYARRVAAGEQTEWLR
jgi:hypothetical protein